MHVVTPKKMKELEEQSEAAGVTCAQLMENAGRAAFACIQARYGLVGKRIVILCGGGNNGGDGYVLARLCCSAAVASVSIIAYEPPRSELAKEMAARLPDAVRCGTGDDAHALLQDADIIVDALFGTGFHGMLPLAAARLLALGEEGAVRVAMDLPSGCDAKEGGCDPAAFQANLTICFGAVKTGLLNLPARGRCGVLEEADIGIPAQLYEDSDVMETMTPQEAVGQMPPRTAQSHKGSFGRLLCVCGSVPMSGAAVMSVKSALRCGTGLTTLAAPRDVVRNIAAALTENTFLPLPQTSDGYLSHEAAAVIVGALTGATACLIGCGLGTGEGARTVVRAVLENASCPVIVDADGLNCACTDIDILRTASCPVILTPHPGEMARLMQKDTAYVQQNRLQCAREFADRLGATVVLKGVGTLIAAPGERTYYNATGNAGLAKGGSGDVLAGMIASFVAQGLRPFDAAVCGVCLHGYAADLVAAHTSMQGMLPTDLLAQLPLLFQGN